ncbi:MAG: CehA/McbA family metallohydrolase [Lentisphaeria bacterium]|jgi:3',5'-cyclic AMP phosphodiesterase CpdA
MKSRRPFFVLAALLLSAVCALAQAEQPLVRFALLADLRYADQDSKAGCNYRQAKELYRQTLARLNQEPDLAFVMVLGDITDGGKAEDMTQMLALAADSRAPVKYLAGDHDLQGHSEEQLKALFAVDDLFYDFAVGGVRFVVINSHDVSLVADAASGRRQAARDFLTDHHGVLFNRHDGMLSAERKQWLRDKLAAANAAGEDVVVFSHTPLWYLAGNNRDLMWDHMELLTLLDGCPRLRGFFAGHYHCGGLSPRRRVLHKTVKALVTASEATACIVSMYRDRLELRGIGAESDYTHAYDFKPLLVRGRAVPGAYVMANTGEITKAGDDGSFSLTLPLPGVYCLKAVADGMADAYLPMLQLPVAEELLFAMTPEPGRRVVHGVLDAPAQLTITDDGEPVRSFDLAGNPYGGLTPPKPGMWHQKNRHYWTMGEYAFSARGEVKITRLHEHPSLRERGWYKGDFHAHIIHGEDIYKGNVQHLAAICQAESYDWIYLAGNFANDRAIADYHGIADALSHERFLLRLNMEYPKTIYGHVGSVGVLPLTMPYDPEKRSNFEQAREYIHRAGGVAIPVHPLYTGVLRKDKASGRELSWMSGRDNALWLLCEPDMMPCLDLFYMSGDLHRTEKYWYSLLNRGYRIACSASSDAAYDVGRTPASGRGATFVKAEALTEAAIVRAFKERRTMVSWNSAALIMDIDGKTSGDIIRPAGKHQLSVDAYNVPGRKSRLRIMRNGEVFAEKTLLFPEDGQLRLEWPLSEQKNCWYLAIMTPPGKNEIAAAASPIYFRNEDFVPPEVLPFPKELPADLRDRIKFMTLDEMVSPAVFDEIADRLRALAKEP